MGKRKYSILTFNTSTIMKNENLEQAIKELKPLLLGILFFFLFVIVLVILLINKNF